MPEWTVVKKGRLVPIPQDDNATCWRAAYQMMFDWKGKAKDTIPTLVKNAVADSVACYTKGLDKPDWEKVGKAFGLTTVSGSKPFTAKTLAGYLANGPVLLHGKFPLGVHSIVITGVSVAGFFDSEDEEMTNYINPYWVGDKVVYPRMSSFKNYIKVGVEKHDGVAGVLQHW